MSKKKQKNSNFYAKNLAAKGYFLINNKYHSTTLQQEKSVVSEGVLWQTKKIAPQQHAPKNRVLSR